MRTCRVLAVARGVAALLSAGLLSTALGQTSQVVPERGTMPVASGSFESSSAVAGPGIHGTGRFYDSPPSLSPEMMLQIDIAQQWCRDHHGTIEERIDPSEGPPTVDPNGVETPVPRPQGAYQVRVPGTFQVWRVTTPSPTVGAAGGGRSTTAEPSAASAQDLIFMTANWFAALSSDGGLTWRYVNPYDNFPSDGTNDVPGNSGIFCCDQNVIYIPAQDLWCWQLQYTTNGNSNVQRTAFFTGRNNMLANNYCFYDWRPSSVGYAANGFWFDFPDLSYTDGFVYLCSNLFAIGAGSTSTCAMLRFPLASVATCSGFTYNYYVDTSHPGFRMCHGSTSIMYFGAHHSTGTMRIYRWPDNSGTISSDDTGHAVYNTGAFSAVTNDGNNWAGNGDTRLLGAYRANGELGFMFHVPQTGGRPYPRTLIKRFSEGTRALTGEQEVYNNSIAFMYPSVAPNTNNEWGGTIMYGAGATYPTGAAWIADGFNGRSMQPMELAYLTTSNGSPASNRYGDYYESARLWLNTNDWVGTVHTINNGIPNAYQAWFGREANTPPADIKAQSCSVPGGIYRQSQNITVSYNTINVGVATTTACTLYFYASTGPLVTGSTYFMGSTNIGTLASTQTIAGSSVQTIPSNIPPGSYYIGYIASDGTESYYGNNTAGYAFPITIRLANDDCANATVIGVGSVTGDTTAATLDGSCACVTTTNRDVYYSFTPPCTGLYRIDTCGSAFDTVLSVHTGCSASAANQIACNDDNGFNGGAGGCSGSLQSALNVFLSSNTADIIRVAGYSTDRFGAFTLNIAGVPPTNDRCPAAMPVGDGFYAFSNCLANTELQSNNACRVGYLDLWYDYTAPCDGVATIDTCNSDYDTVLMAFNGCPVDATAPIACNDDAGCGYFGLGSVISFPTTAGAHYMIRLAAYSSGRGGGQVQFSCQGANMCGCAADYNQDGGIDGADVGAFFADWEGATGCADVNQDGGIDGADVGAFFDVWQAGGC